MCVSFLKRVSPLNGLKVATDSSVILSPALKSNLTGFKLVSLLPKDLVRFSELPNNFLSFFVPSATKILLSFAKGLT